jgi:NhaC family Na+:H+ antiporter
MSIKNPDRRKPTFAQSLAPILFMVVLIAVGYGYFRLATEPLLIIAAFFSAIIVSRLGYTWKEMQDSINEKILISLPAILILWSVGFIIGSWMFAGTVPMIIYYGVQIISPKYLLVTGFLLTAIVSTATGTSWGSAGTMGVAIIGIAAGLGVPLPMAAGAVVSGAYFGDKLSPLSDSTNIAPIAAGSELYEHIRHMLYTTVPAAILSIIVYLIAGFTLETSGSAVASTSALLNQLDAMYTWNPILLLPAVLMIYGSLKKWPPMPTMLGTSILATILGVIIQGFSMKNGFSAMVKGFNVSMTGFEGDVLPMVTTLLNRGGGWGAAGTTVLIICAMGFAGIIASAGMLDVVMERLASKIKSVLGLVATTVFSCVTMAIVTGSSYLTILIPGELYRNEYKKRNLHPKNLSRTLEDSGTVFVGIVPWSAAGVFMTNALGVSTLEYLPWAVLNYSGMIFALILAATKFGIAPLDVDKPIGAEIDVEAYEAVN